MAMDSAQRRRVRDLFEAALDREPTADVHDWIAREAADDPIVRDEVQSLLTHHSRAGQFLSQPIADRVPDLLADDEPLPPGAKVGAYTIVRELGRGGMGRVYLARDERLGRTVALKALAPHLVRDPSQRERLRREARAAAGLTHPGICTVYALEEMDGELYIATEFVDGHTLGDEIRMGRSPANRDVLRTARELADALASAHAKNIVHRDLKPDNVMRTADGRLKILDFGLARIDNPDRIAPATIVTQPGVVIGTPAYMSPEQINGQPVDARADVFAFGVLLYEYACGVHPFLGSTTLATVARVLESDARPITARCPDISSGLADVISRCLRKAPSERYGSAAEIAAALAAVGESASGPARATTWWRTHQIVVTLLYIVAAVLSWQIKDWMETPVTVSIFLALGACATIGGVLRGHLAFTDWMNRAQLVAERKRTAHATRLLDATTSVLLFTDAALIARQQALPAVFALSLALGIALAALLLEPATNRAAFGDQA
jgi:eukaryotic-like serine/threonine-protein kinase